jgi:hypothetical protein
MVDTGVAKSIRIRATKLPGHKHDEAALVPPNAFFAP